MYKVDAESLEAYLAYDPVRRAELDAFDRAMATAAPRLERYFHPGTPPGEPGMRFKMIGYGRFHYAARGKIVEWPVVGLALQKNYISAYFTPRVDGRPVTERYAAQLGASRMGENNFSFISVAQLDAGALTELLTETSRLFFEVPNSMAAFELVVEQ